MTRPAGKVSAEAQNARRAQRFAAYDCSEGCPVEAALELIGGKWKGVALFHLSDGTKRFNELKRLAGTVTQRTLTKQLRELEADGLISRTVYPVIPPKVEYALTQKGRSLIPVLGALRDWGTEHALPKRGASESRDGSGGPI
jgi:DNA-binding HxlR family transcriptional regulator